MIVGMGMTVVFWAAGLTADPSNIREPPISASVWEAVGETGLMRLAVPSGWLVRAIDEPVVEAELVFVPDQEYAWRRAASPSWEMLAIEGGDLQRIAVPHGWIVTMKGAESGGSKLVFVPDRRLVWQPKR